MAYSHKYPDNQELAGYTTQFFPFYLQQNTQYSP